MTTEPMTMEQIRQRGLEALAKALGPVGMIRFLQQFETGKGDYTEEREQWLGNPDLQELAEKIRRMQQPGEPA